MAFVIQLKKKDIVSKVQNSLDHVSQFNQALMVTFEYNEYNIIFTVKP